MDVGTVHLYIQVGLAKASDSRLEAMSPHASHGHAGNAAEQIRTVTDGHRR